MVLVDTSVWVEVFRKSKPLQLDAHVDIDEVVTRLRLASALSGFGEASARQAPPTPRFRRAFGEAR